jgi:DNA-binding response OmpR family regulator
LVYDFSKVRALIVEDQLPLRIMLRAGLEAFGFKEIFDADDGEEGLDSALRHQPDLAFVDWLMEPMDGLTFTRIVRRGRRGLNPELPIVLFTSDSSRVKVIEARDAGVSSLVAKPIVFDLLYRRIVALIETPVKFVRGRDFIGPDRRRRHEEPAISLRRRNEDKQEDGAA